MKDCLYGHETRFWAILEPFSPGLQRCSICPVVTPGVWRLLREGDLLNDRRGNFEQDRMTPGKLCAAARGRSPKGRGAERSRRQPRSVNSARSAYFPCEAPYGCFAGDSERIVFYILFIVYMGAKNDPHVVTPGIGKNLHKSLNHNSRNT